jgi:hypothetical protein
MKDWVRFFGLLLGTIFSFNCSSQVRDVRGYEIKESGYLGRPSGILQDIFWLDYERVIFIGANPREHVEPVAGVKELRFGLFVWNVKAGTVQRHFDKDIANGNLCVFQGYVRLEFTPDFRRSPVDQNWYAFEGPFGKERPTLFDRQMREEQRNYQRVTNRFTCRDYRRSELPPLGFRVTPLLDGEFLTQDREQRLVEVVHWKYWPRDGSPVMLNLTPEMIGIERYSEYLDSYVLQEYPSAVIFSDKVIRRWWILDRNGRIRDFTPPTGPWMRGSTVVVPTKQGLFLASHAIDIRGGNGAAGGYLLDDKGLYRVIAGRPESLQVSPDGCRVAISISDRTRKGPIERWIKTVDVCSRGG